MGGVSSAFLRKKSRPGFPLYSALGSGQLQTCRDDIRQSLAGLDGLIHRKSLHDLIDSWPVSVPLKNMGQAPLGVQVNTKRFHPMLRRPAAKCYRRRCFPCSALLTCYGNCSQKIASSKLFSHLKLALYPPACPIMSAGPYPALFQYHFVSLPPLNCP